MSACSFRGETKGRTINYFKGWTVSESPITSLPSALSRQKAADPSLNNEFTRSLCVCADINKFGEIGVANLWYTRTLVMWVEVWHMHMYIRRLLQAHVLNERDTMASLQGTSKLLQAAVRLHSRRIPRGVSTSQFLNDVNNLRCPLMYTK